MKIRRTSSVAALVLAGIVLCGCSESGGNADQGGVQLVTTKGQHYPVPERWLDSEEARITHDLVLPDSIPQPVPFDFDSADGSWFWPKSEREVARAYFNHLCRTEAGEWILEKHENVDGFYIARPPRKLTESYVSDVNEPEAPVVEKEFTWLGDDGPSRVGYFADPPFRNYQFVEEPKGAVDWQVGVPGSYIRISSGTARFRIDADGIVKDYSRLSPASVQGIDEPTSKYAFTWRGITRPGDRRFRIAGGELIVYERETKRVIAVSRTFLLGARTTGKSTVALWVQSPACRQGVWPGGLFLAEFVRRVLQEKKIPVHSQNKGTYLWQPHRSQSYMNFH